MQNLHVGRGTDRGALTVFPIWGEQRSTRGYTMRMDHVGLTEVSQGPSVDTLVVHNASLKPLLVLEGHILEGGWQNRMVARSSMIESYEYANIDVVCVEAGRWGSGERAHRSFGRRASARVRSGLRQEDRQGEVWRRVAEFDGRVGANATSSYTEHADRAADRIRALTDELRPFPGQVGVLIGLAGQPILAEIFDSSTSLARQFESIVNAAAMDALWLDPIPTPGRRARRFIERAGRLRQDVVGEAGTGHHLLGRTEYVEASSLLWRRRSVHTVLTNPRHELVAA